jgi:hypothetical protein
MGKAVLRAETLSDAWRGTCGWLRGSLISPKMFWQESRIALCYGQGCTARRNTERRVAWHLRMPPRCLKFPQKKKLGFATMVGRQGWLARGTMHKIY